MLTSAISHFGRAINKRVDDHAIFPRVSHVLLVAVVVALGMLRLAIGAFAQVNALPPLHRSSRRSHAWSASTFTIEGPSSGFGRSPRRAHRGPAG